MEITKIWQEIILNLIKEKSVSSIGYDLWIKPLIPFCMSGNTLVLVAPLNSTKLSVIDKYLDTIKAIAKKTFAYIDEVIVISEAEKSQYQTADIKKDDTALEFEDSLTLNKSYTFDNFVIGGNNQIVYYAAKSVAEYPGDQHNPLFIYGGVGLGKTHIMQAIGNYIKEKTPRQNLLYITTAQFVNEFLDSLQDRSEENRFNEANRKFREKYRRADVLMIDDIQFISNKKACQEALFHTFNDLYQNKKQIIFTSDRHPREIKELEERLLSRFQSGLTVDISEPDFETRVAILKKKALQRNFIIDNHVATFIAEKVDSNIRELEGALSKVIFYCSLVGVPADNIEIVREALKDTIEDSTHAITIDTIVDVTCSYFNTAKADIIGKKKTKQIVEPRQFCMYLINDIMSLPLATIGEYFGGRDHTTIMYARDKIDDLIKKDEIQAKKITDLKNMIMKK